MSAVGLGLAGGTALVETAVRWRTSYIARSEKLAPGLVTHDETLGWRLTPSWEGTHTHYDFSARYRVGFDGFRRDVAVPSNFKGKRYAVVGDSFTFGFGVNDDQTFARRLSEAAMPEAIFINHGVPGYSTDQETLLVEQKVLGLRPDGVILVVCLANDLLDNQFQFPMQVMGAKPYFEFGPEGLVLKGTPVPRQLAPGRGSSPSLQEAVLGEEALRGTLWARLEQRLETFRLLRQCFLRERDYAPEFRDRFRGAMRISKAVLKRLASDCAGAGARFTLALIAGRSFVEEPKSLSAQYQDYFRRGLLEFGAQEGLQVIDVAGGMRARKNKGRWFYPHDGHLTPEGHGMVAEILLQKLPNKQTAGGGVQGANEEVAG